MTVVLIEGFDSYNGTQANIGLQTKWTLSAAPTAALVAGRFTGQAIHQLHNSNYSTPAYFERGLPANYAAFGIGHAFKYDFALTANDTQAFTTVLDSAGNFQLGLKLNSNGSISVVRMSSATAGTVLGTTAAGVLLVNTWHYIEWGSVISATVGTVKLKVDGVAVLTLAGVNTLNSANVNVGKIRFGHSANFPTTDTQYRYDDVYVVDSDTTLGERRVETIYPSADVAQGFARSTGTANFSLVNEAQVNGDTNYVQASTLGDVDTYALGDLSGISPLVSAIQINSYARKTDAATRAIAMQLKSGATVSNGPDFNLSASYNKFERIEELDPNTGVAWTAAGINALQAGPKVSV